VGPNAPDPAQPQPRPQPQPHRQRRLAGLDGVRGLAALYVVINHGHPASLLRLLEWRPVRRLGDSSYSLYLTHAPIVAVVCERIVAGRVGRGVPTFLVSLALVLPLSIAFARVFASVFETPFRRPRSWPPVVAWFRRTSIPEPTEALLRH
jgi:peptidoglycan/LPS O-acetylase OafA/YrhL